VLFLFVVVAGLVFLFPWGPRVSAVIVAIGAGSLLILSAQEGGTAGCFIFFDCDAPDPYAGMATGLSVLYLAIACLLKGLIHGATMLVKALRRKARTQV
jgi:hypothetical protein